MGNFLSLYLFYGVAYLKNTLNSELLILRPYESLITEFGESNPTNQTRKKEQNTNKQTTYEKSCVNGRAFPSAQRKVFICVRL